MRIYSCYFLTNVKEVLESLFTPIVLQNCWVLDSQTTKQCQ